MKISEHVYRVHINEDDSPFGTYHPGGSSIYFIGNPNTNMVVMDTGEHYRSWTDQILTDYFVFDLVTSYNLFDNYKMQFSINNIFDEKYEQAHEYSTMGRNFNFGIRRVY